MTDADLRRVAGAFRTSVERLAPFDQAYAAFRNFPTGCCKDASFVLARILDAFLKPDRIDYVWGMEPGPDLSTHGWLEVGGRVVDVTGVSSAQSIRQ